MIIPHWRSSLNPIVLSPDGNLFAISPAGKGEVELYNASSGEKRSVVKRYLKGVATLVYSSDSTMVAAAESMGPRIEIWQLLQDKTISLPQATAEYSHWVRSAEKDGTSVGTMGHPREKRMSFSLNGKRIVRLGPGEKTSSLWDSTTETLLEPLGEFERPIQTFAFSSESKLLAIARDGYIKICQVAGSEAMQTSVELHAPGCQDELAFSSDCKMMAAASFRDITLWDVSTGEIQQAFSAPGQVSPFVSPLTRISLQRGCGAEPCNDGVWPPERHCQHLPAVNRQLFVFQSHSISYCVRGVWEDYSIVASHVEEVER
ncbi:hypothetical protein BDW74DRAFT_178226 [Aspergillus multicolor]|uniref:WD40 repeat domain-containing protein n=1 Tax=Aspergillus multicolor TaxID=41759 RepID=UPI003CCD3272